MDVIASVAFETQVDSQNNTDDPFVRHAQLFFSFSLFRPIALLFGQSKYFFLLMDLCSLLNLRWNAKRYTVHTIVTSKLISFVVIILASQT